MYLQKIKIHLVVLATLLLLASTIGTIGCLNQIENGYTRVTVTRNGLRFSFEYPVTYDDVGTLNEGSEENNVVLFHWLNRNRAEADTIISFTMEETCSKNETASYKSAYDMVEKTIKKYSDNLSNREFKLLDRSNSNFGKYQGEMILYSMNVLPTELDLGLKNDSGLIPIIIRSVYFDYEGYIWNFQVQSIMDVADQAKSDFERISRTFRILN